MHKRILSLLSIFLFAVSHSQTAVIDRTISSIPDSLKKEADAVYRLDEGKLEIFSPSEYKLKVHQVLTILTAEGSHHLHHSFAHDKFYKVEDVEVGIYDAMGLAVKKYSRKDFENRALFDGISLVTDDKLLKLYTPAPGFPCTVEVMYTIHATGYLDLPNWYVNTNKTSSQLFRYEVKVPANLDIRHRTLNIALTPTVSTIGNLKQYTWEAGNIPAKRLESEGFEPARYLPQIEVAPNEFSYDGYRGSFRNWQDFGAWSYKLYEEVKPFTPQRTAEIQAMVAHCNSREEKISALYRYLQKNMRYVSIQLGIGGFKPFAIKFVDEKKYGDCKALTNYMRYLLQTVGIPSYPALINAGHNKVPADASFPTNPFNHVILCVPGQKDTIWLECTSTDNRAGELGTFTENKRALLLTEKGGILVNTPQSDYRANETATSNAILIHPDGSAVVRNRLRSRGEPVSFYQLVGQLKDDEQKETLVKYLHYKAPEELEVKKTGEPEDAVFEVNRSYEKLYEFKAGNKYFFPLCVNKLATETVKPFKRETSFLLEYPYIKRDTSVFQLPQGFALEAVPANKEIFSEASYYKRSCRFDKEKKQLIVVSELSLKQHVIPPTWYDKLVSFFREVTAAEEESIVLLMEQPASF